MAKSGLNSRQLPFEVNFKGVIKHPPQCLAHSRLSSMNVCQILSRVQTQWKISEKRGLRGKV